MTQKPRALVIERDLEVAQILVSTLKDFIVEVRFLGPTGVQTALQEDVTLIIVDYRPPGGMYALDILKAIKSKKPEVAIHIVTGKNLTRQETSDLIEAGAASITRKPFKVSTIKTLLGAS